MLPSEVASPPLMLLLQPATPKYTALASTDWYLEQFAVDTKKTEPHHPLLYMASLLVFQFSLLFMWIPRYLHPGTTPTSCPRIGLCGCPLPSKLHHHLSEADDSSQTTPQNRPLLLCTPNTSNHLTVVRVILQTADVSEKCLKLWFVLLI